MGQSDLVGGGRPGGVGGARARDLRTVGAGGGPVRGRVPAFGPAAAPGRAIWLRIPNFPGPWNQLVRKNLREILSTLDFYCAVLLCLSTIAFRLAGIELPAEAFIAITVLAVLALSSYAQMPLRAGWRGRPQALSAAADARLADPRGEGCGLPADRDSAVASSGAAGRHRCRADRCSRSAMARR